MKRTAWLPVVAISLWLALPILSGAEEHADLPPTHTIEPEMYATGFEFAEGPVMDSHGNLFVVNYRRLGTIGRIAADGTASIFCDLQGPEPQEGREPQANGLKIDRQGRLIAADSGTGQLLRIAADGASVEVLADRWEGNRFNVINDVALDLEGNIYFSDCGDSSVKNPTGSIYRYDIKIAKVSQLATGLAYPNGLAVTPDQKRFCLSESARYRLLIYDLSADGKLSNRRVLIDFPTETRGKIIGGTTEPDGMIFDDTGRLYVAMWTGGVINVVEIPPVTELETGKLIRQYNAGGTRATNCHFHDGYLYTTVAAKEAVFRLKLGVKGFDYSPSTAE
jgi:gluconolactonase